MCCDRMAEPPTPNDSNSAQSWQKKISSHLSTGLLTYQGHPLIYCWQKGYGRWVGHGALDCVSVTWALSHLFEISMEVDRRQKPVIFFYVHEC